jgi:hypothetical protein
LLNVKLYYVKNTFWVTKRETCIIEISICTAHLRFYFNIKMQNFLVSPPRVINKEPLRKRKAMAAMFVLYLVNTMKRETRLCRTSSLSGEAWTQELLGGHPGRFLENCRLEKDTFILLKQQLVSVGHLKASRFVSSDQQLLIFLWICGHNASVRQAQERFQHSGETISRYFRQTLKEICGLAGTFIKLPDGTTIPPEIMNNRKFFPYFEDCVGAIDGTHVPAKVSGPRAAAFRNRKGYVSQNVLAACSFDLRFQYVLPGWEGSAHDGAVLQDALSKDFVVPTGKYFLADAGYALSEGFLTPYRSVRYHLKEWARGNLT